MAITSLTGVQTAIPFRRQVTLTGNQATNGIPRFVSGSNFTIPANPPDCNAYIGNINLNLYYSAAIRFGTLFVFDFIYAVTVANSTSLQTLTTPGIGNRDMNGTTRGDGVFLIVYTGGNLGGATTTLSVTYTSSDGNIGRVGTSTPFASAQGQTFYFIGLQNGDTGVRSVQSAQFSALPGGAMTLLCVRPITVITSPMVVNGDAQADAISLGLPQVYDGSNILIAYGNTGQVFGQIKFIYG